MKRRKNRYMYPLCVLGMILIGLTTLGCNSVDSGKLGLPNLRNPGTAQVQQNRAVRFDPFPEPDVGPYTEGLRPRDYDKPLAQPLRARWPIIE